MDEDDLQITLGPVAGPGVTAGSGAVDPVPTGASGASGAPPVQIVVAAPVLDEMDGHVAADTSVEHGGVMVGHVDEAAATTHVVGSIRALGAESDIASLRFTHETWDHIGSVMERDFPGKQMVGWYHSHPHFGIFLSEHDQFIHRNFFSQPWQVAYVRDPLLDQRGFFAWTGEHIEHLPWEGADGGSGSEVAPGASRVAVVAGGATSAPGVEAPVPTTPVPAPRRGRRGGRLLVLVGLLAVVAIAAGALLLGPLSGDDEAAEAALVLDTDLASDRIAPAGTVVQIAEIQADLEPGERLEWAADPLATSPRGRQSPVTVLPVGDDAISVFVVTTEVLEDSYQLVLPIWTCEQGVECTLEQSLSSESASLDFEVLRAWTDVVQAAQIDQLVEDGCVDGLTVDPDLVQPPPELDLTPSTCGSGASDRVLTTFDSEYEPRAGESPDNAARNRRAGNVREASAQCLAAYEGRLERSYTDVGGTGVAVVVPTDGEWEAGERRVACVLVDWQDPSEPGGGRTTTTASPSDDGAEGPTSTSTETTTSTTSSAPETEDA
jgi:proteasome lid subunit RPN8/RPN11